MPISPRQAVEVFHLHFLRLLTAGADRGLYTLKGGINLRFFFKSVRFSDDLDIDVTVAAKGTIKAKVDKLLAGRPLQVLLGGAGIAIQEATAPKQTDTTQAWKIALQVQGSSAPLRTKIELSRRPSAGETRFEAVDRVLAQGYRLTPPLVSHYTAAAALVQKLGALAGRAQPQARDVFDLHLLMAHVDSKLRLPAATRSLLPRAALHAIGFSYDDYRAQVVAFLEPEQQEMLGSRAHWDEMQTAVVEFIEGLAKP